MRNIQTITTDQIAFALAKAEEGTGPNFAPSDEGIARVKRALDNIADERGFDKSALRGAESVTVQDVYVEQRQDGLTV